MLLDNIAIFRCLCNVDGLKKMPKDIFNCLIENKSNNNNNAAHREFIFFQRYDKTQHLFNGPFEGVELVT